MCSLHRAAVGFGFIIAALGAPWSTQAETSAQGAARALEERLHAPCCRHQMLEKHESEAAHALRAELRTRFARGESSASIEQVLIERYGASIIAVPADRDPRGPVSWALFVLLALSAAGLVVAGRRWRDKKGAFSPPRPPEYNATERAELDRKLEAELQRERSEI